MAAPPSTFSRDKLPRITRRRGPFGNNPGDPIFYGATLLFAASVLIICLLILWQLFKAATPAIQIFGLPFLTSTQWDPNADKPAFGALPYIYGTLVSSFLALLMAVPIGLGTAIFLAELAPRKIRMPLSFLVELLAAVPSVVYGLWGRLVMVPWLQEKQDWLGGPLFDWLQGVEKTVAKVPGLGWVPKYGLSHLVDGAPTGYSMMAGALVLAIMILPFITAVSREVIKAVPPTQREAAYGLGSTRWEAIKGPVLKYARAGIVGAIILGLARALGETMAITMVIGNGNELSTSLLAPANTLASKLANEFNEASGPQLSSLMYLALILFCITIAVNALARLLIWKTSQGMRGARE